MIKRRSFLFALKFFLRILSNVAKKLTQHHSDYKANLANLDALTGLYNRRAFDNYLLKVIKSSKIRGHHTALILIDLDRFKPINDLYGHDIGDHLLISVGQRLKSIMRQDDFLARIGGDEFAIVLKSTSADEEVRGLCDRVLASLQKEFQLDHLVCHIGASIGYSCFRFSDGLLSSADFVKQADLALYRAKTSSITKVCAFNLDLATKELNRSHLSCDLKYAIEEEKIEAYLQPIFRLNDMSIEGYEILARWNHDELGAIGPKEFIGLALNLRLINELTKSLLTQALRYYVKFHPNHYLALNLTASQICDRSLPHMILEIITKYDFNPNLLHIEITEVDLNHNLEAALDCIHEIKMIGCRIILDDFGSGISSLNILRQVSFDGIKIDDSVIKNIRKTKNGLRFIQAMISLANTMNIKVTAEAVETHEEIKVLSQIGCHSAQGFYLGMPFKSGGLTYYEPHLDVLKRDVA